MVLRLVVVLCLLFAPRASLAQTAPLPVPDDEPSQPPSPPGSPPPDAPPAASRSPAATPSGAAADAAFWANSLIMPSPSFTLLPVESGALDSHVELQLAFTRTCDFASNVATNTNGAGMPASASECLNVVLLALDGQYAIRDRLEIGLNLMFLEHAVASYGTSSASDTELGNLTLDLKAKILGRSRGPFALSVFANTTFPTGTGIRNREWAILHAGVAVSGALSIVTLGLDAGSYWYINGKGKDVDYFLLNLFTGVRIHSVFSAFLAMQMGVAVYPGTSDIGFALSPGLRVTPYRGLYLDLAARIAATDVARLMYTAVGRADLIFNGGYRF
jgi:hypothetical protein